MVARQRRERARPLVLLFDETSTHAGVGDADSREGEGTSRRNTHAMLLKLALMHRGYAIVVAHSIEGAVTMARAKPIDVLIALTAATEAKALLDVLGDARPSAAIALGESAEGFDLVMPTPVDFGELDASMRGLLMRRGSGTRRRVLPRR